MDGLKGKSLPGVFVKTFGCQMNLYDTEKIYSVLSGTYKPVNTAEGAALIIVNTCSVREKARNKFYSLVGTFENAKRFDSSVIVGIGGCVAEQDAEIILSRCPTVDFVVGTAKIDRIPELIERVKKGLGPCVAVGRTDEREDDSPRTGNFTAGGMVHATLPEDASGGASWPFLGSTVRAMVAVQRGCSRSCSYCVVPKTRGPAVSRPAEDIIREVELKVELGAKEVLLLGQTVNSWGRDLRPRLDFAELLRAVVGISGVKRIRFTSPHPTDFSDEFLQVFGSLSKLCPHVHLPLQSGSDAILRSMRRNYTAEDYLKVVEKIRAVRPGVAITSDIIVAFPGETSEDFEATLRIMDKVAFSASYSFTYSPRPGTSAFSRFPEGTMVDASVGSARLKEIQALQDDLSLGHNSAKIGQEVEVLVEAKAKNVSSGSRGRTKGNVWTEIEDALLPLGTTARVLVQGASPHGLRGRLVDHQALKG